MTKPGPKSLNKTKKEQGEGEMNRFRAGQRVKIADGWFNAGRLGRCLGRTVFVRQDWTPVVWDDEEDPFFHKTCGLSPLWGRER